MEPTEINGGRFYARPLHNDERIDDTPALAVCNPGAMEPESVDSLREKWAQETMYTWAVCEQTNVEMIGLAVLHLTELAVLDVLPVGDPSRKLPNDPVLVQKTVGDVVEIRGPILRWAQAHGIEVAQ